MDRRGLEPLRIGAVTIDFTGERLVDEGGRRIALRPQSFAVLSRLAAAPDQVVAKSVLMDAVWPGLAVTEDSLVQCIHEIRRALGPEGERALRTVPRRGYVLHPPGPPPDPPPGPSLAREPAPAIRRPRRVGQFALALLLLAAALVAARGSGGARTP
ncbi:MAG TPA: winged helix-turn-helix domain-containing protein [Amaricoccus sp.]|nr:winged helix-turn-helix domain-containing protein [Amaricoccus sp.]